MSSDQYAYTPGSPPLDAPGADRRSDQQQQQHRYSPVAAVPGGYGVGGRHQAHTHVQYPATGMNTAPQRRRLSNAPSDGTTEGRSHAGPAPARRTAAVHADHDATSEDEIESLKRDMSSDLWALQRQRMRREQLNNNRQRPPGSTTESPNSPLTHDASPMTKGKAMALGHYQKPAGLALHRQEISPPPPLAPHLPELAGQSEWPAYADASGPIESTVPSSPHGYSAYVYPATGSSPQPYAQVIYAHQPHYAHHQQHHFQAPPPQQHHAQTTQAYSAAVAAAAAYAAQAPAPAYVHGRQLTTAPPLPPIVDATSASRDYSVPPGYSIDAPHYIPKLWPTAGGYPIATTNVDNSGRYESASVQSNDQVSVSFTDASGYSQQQIRPQHATNPFATAIAAAAISNAYTGGSSASTDHHGRPLPEQVSTYPTQHQLRYPRQQQQVQQQSPPPPPPPMVNAHSPLHRAAGSPPMEQKRLHANAVVAETGQSPAAYSTGVNSVVRAADHVTDMGSTPAYYAYTSRAQQQHHHQPLPVAAARVSPPMQEMQEHHSTLADPTSLATFGRQSPSAPYPALSGPMAAINAGAKVTSTIAIQSLLNSPLEDTFAGVADDVDSCGSAESGSDTAAIHQHIAKENARFRQHSSASGQLPIPPHIAPSAPTAHHHNSSPNSRSSYHSAGYSIWHGRAETVNLDFATAQQSLSSTDDPAAAGLGLSMAHENQRQQHPAYLPNAPLPTIPASFTYAANAAATAFAASAIASLPPPNQADDYQYRYYKPDNKRDSKPISVLVQVSDGSREGSVTGNDDDHSDEAPAFSPPDSNARLPSEVQEPSSPRLPESIVEDVEGDMLSGDSIVKIPLGRKGTNESLDNVLEYYRTHSSETLDKRASSSELVPPVSEAEVQQQQQQQLESSLDEDALFALSGHDMSHPANMASKADLNATRSDSMFDVGFQSPLSLTGGSRMAAAVATESASSDPVRRRQHQQHYDGWSESRYSSLGAVTMPAESSVLGTRPHTREQTPVADSSPRVSGYDSPPSHAAIELHDNEQLLSARHWHIEVGDSYIADMDMYSPHVAPNPWQQRHPPPMYHHSDIYDALEQLPEPETLELPPTTAAEAGLGVADDDDDDGVVQMEMIDGISELSDMLDMSTTHDSDYGYSNSNSSTDSFGEPIEHETGILAKSLGPQVQNIAALTDMSESVSRLTDDFSRTALAPTMVIHQLSTQRGPQPSMHSYFSHVAPPPGTVNDQRLSVLASIPPDGAVSSAAQRLAELGGARERLPDSYSSMAQEMDSGSAEALHSGRTNASTLTTSTSPEEHAPPITAVAADTGNEAHLVHGAVTAVSAIGTITAPTVAAADIAQVVAATAATTTANNMPLEIMELAGELEISLAREQEDYYSDNVSQANLDPMILQNLGKAVHQQCLLQRQHVQRRKSNMHLGLAGGGNSSSDEHGAVPAADLPYDDYELALKAMLVEVSQYFAQSGLNQVFPFSAKWVDWLTRHPDRPFPWRKDPEDDDEANRDNNNAGGHDGGDVDDDIDSRSDVSSFGEEPPALSRPLPPEDVLSKATIPMSMRRPVLVKDFVSQEKRRGINAHWQYYSVINQITAVASGIHRRLVVEEADADHSFVAHQLAALYQFLGGDFKKFKPGIESIFETIKQSLCIKSTSASKAGVECEGEADGVRPVGPKVLDAKCVSVLREMMASIIAEALYSTSKVAATGVKEHPPPNTPTAGIRAAKQAAAAAVQTQTQQTVVDGPLVVREASYAISTLKGLPTQPIVRYLAKEMRAVNGERRRRGLAHNLSRNNSMGHMRHHQFSYQTQPPLPPLPPMPVPAVPQVPHVYHSGSSASSTNHAAAAVDAVEHNRVRRNNSHWQTPMLKQEATTTVVPPLLQPILSADEDIVQSMPADLS